jgi:NADH-quinone oxidoreductase subunit N
MSLLFAVSPLLIVTLGALLLMLTEAFAVNKPKNGDLALGTAVALFGGAALSIAVWLVGPETLEASAMLAPYLLIDRFTMFFGFVICVGGAVATCPSTASSAVSSTPC